MIARSVKFVLCAMVFTLMALALQTAEAKTLYIITIYGTDETMEEDCDEIIDLFGSSRVYNVIPHKIPMKGHTQQDLLDEIGTVTHSASSSDIVVIYIASHGSYYREEDGNTEFYYYASAVSDRFYNQLVFRQILDNEECEAKLKLFISDTCTTRDVKRRTDEQIGTNIEESEDDSNTMYRGGDSTNDNPSEITILENKPLLRNNLDWLMESEGNYRIFASARGGQAEGTVFRKVLQKALNENNYYKAEIDTQIRFSSFMENLEKSFQQYEQAGMVSQKIRWQDYGNLIIPRVVRRRLTGRIENYDHKGVIVALVWNTFPDSPVMQAKLKKSDAVLGYILSDYDYDLGTVSAYMESKWNYMNSNADTMTLSKKMQKQKYLYLKVLHRKYDTDLSLLYYQEEIVKIDLEKARRSTKSEGTDLKFGMSALGYDEL